MRNGPKLQAEIIKGTRQGLKEIKGNKERVDERDSQPMAEQKSL